MISVALSYKVIMDFFLYIKHYRCQHHQAYHNYTKKKKFLSTQDLLTNERDLYDHYICT